MKLNEGNHRIKNLHSCLILMSFSKRNENLVFCIYKDLNIVTFLKVNVTSQLSKYFHHRFGVRTSSSVIESKEIDSKPSFLKLRRHYKGTSEVSKSKIFNIKPRMTTFPRIVMVKFILNYSISIV